MLRAARRLASWAAAMELAAAADLWRRRTNEEDAGDTGAALHADAEIATALTLTRHAADQLLNLAVALHRLPATSAAPWPSETSTCPAPKSLPTRSPA